MVDIAGRDNSNRAGVTAATRIRMNAFMQLRRDAERERREKTCQSESRDKSTRGAVSHRSRASTWLTNCATDFSDTREIRDVESTEAKQTLCGMFGDPLQRYA